MNINILRALIRSCLFWHDYNFSLFEGYPSCVFYSLFSKTSDTRDSKPRLTFKCRGSGCGSVGRAVASDTRGPRFEYSHRQLLFNQYFLWTLCRKDENKEKEDGNGPFKKIKCNLRYSRQFCCLKYSFSGPPLAYPSMWPNWWFLKIVGDKFSFKLSQNISSLVCLFRKTDLATFGAFLK